MLKSELIYYRKNLSCKLELSYKIHVFLLGDETTLLQQPMGDNSNYDFQNYDFYYYHYQKWKKNQSLVALVLIDVEFGSIQP